MAAAETLKLSRIKPTAYTQIALADQINAWAVQMLLPKANSSYMGDNIPGKPRMFIPHLSETYHCECGEVLGARCVSFKTSAA